MARPRKSRGFTLVELLVVITIIGMLVSLLLPAIQQAREAGRRTTCLNNMRQVAIGLATLEQAQKGFPGYVRAIDKPMNSRIRASWIVSVLPALEANAIYQNWMSPTVMPQFNPSTPATFNKSQFITQLSILMCPSNANPDLADDANSFAINTGMAVSANDNHFQTYMSGPNWPEDSASGVSFDEAQMDYGLSPKKVGMDYITSNDGSTNTLLISENLQTGGWAMDPNSAPVPLSYQSDFAARQCGGLVWFLTGNKDNQGPATNSALTNGYDAYGMGINEKGQVLSAPPIGKYNQMNTSQATGLAYCRPSSYHPAGVNSMFCGSNGRFLSESMDYKVYTQIMTPNQKNVIVDRSGMNTYKSSYVPSGATIQNPQSSGGTYNVPLPWSYILNDADL